MMAIDGKDPLQKLRELQEWLANNRPLAQLAPKPAVVKSTWALQSPQAVAEVEDFQDWIKHIQSPHAAL